MVDEVTVFYPTTVPPGAARSAWNDKKQGGAPKKLAGTAAIPDNSLPLSAVKVAMDHTDKAPIFAISRLRMETDGPGITTLVTFMGCPLRCRYCLNRRCHEPVYEEDHRTPRQGIRLLSPQELYECVKIDNLYFQATGGGVCFGGGEPTLYPHFIKAFKQLCGEKWNITLETSLHCSSETIGLLSDVVDYWIVDIKSIDPAIYQSYTEQPSRVMQTLSWLQTLVPKDRVTIKVPHIPGYNDERDVEKAIREIEKRFGFGQVKQVEYLKR